MKNECPYCGGDCVENDKNAIDSFCDGYAGDIAKLVVDGQEMPFTIEEDADSLIERIATVLAEADGDFIAEIATKVIGGKITYCQDSFFKIER